MLREECCGKKGVDRQLCGTAHKRGQQNGHFTVTFRWKSTACHNARNGTAKADKHRHDAAAGKTDLSQQLIHNKGYSCHISAVFQQRQEEEQCNNDRQEA